MARIEFRKLGHSYRGQSGAAMSYALQPMEQVWEDGGAYALLGPSGCGKTTLLNIISGLIHPSEGQVLFDGRDVTGQSTEQRNIAQVFQFPVIYDTMTVFDNLAFPLRNRRVAEREVRARVEQVAELLDLQSDLKRRASGLAADAKQKISLGRGLVRQDVAAILFDEPLTVIDPHLKWTLRRKLKQIHQEFRLTLIYVTHDQTEALTFADQVVVMYEGRIVQTGSPQQLFEDPEHVFVGHFIGSPGMNLLPCVVSDGVARVAGLSVSLPPGCAERAAAESGEMQLGIRPEFLQYSSVSRGDALAVEICAIEDLGNCKVLTAVLAGLQLKVKVGEDVPAHPGAGWLHFPPQRTRLYINGTAFR
jgi:glycerol transport system ATP-binding protein